MTDVTVTVDGEAIDVKGVTIALVTADTPPIDPPIEPPVEPPVEPPPVVIPPPVIIPPPDLGDAVSWPSVFDGSSFGQYKSYRVAHLVPDIGLYIYFKVPKVTSFLHTFTCAERRSLPSPLRFSISETVGDMIGLANRHLINYDERITGGYPSGRDCILHPGRTYFWNIQWTEAAQDHIWLSYAYKSPI